MPFARCPSGPILAPTPSHPSGALYLLRHPHTFPHPPTPSHTLPHAHLALNTPSVKRHPPRVLNPSRNPTLRHTLPHPPTRSPDLSHPLHRASSRPYLFTQPHAFPRFPTPLYTLTWLCAPPPSGPSLMPPSTHPPGAFTDSHNPTLIYTFSHPSTRSPGLAHPLHRVPVWRRANLLLLSSRKEQQLRGTARCHPPRHRNRCGPRGHLSLDPASHQSFIGREGY